MSEEGGKLGVVWGPSASEAVGRTALGRHALSSGLRDSCLISGHGELWHKGTALSTAGSAGTTPGGQAARRWLFGPA